MSQSKVAIVNRNVLDSALARLSGAVTRTNTLPILSHLLLESNGQMLALTASNLDLSVSSRIPVSGDAFETTVPAAKLHDIVRLLPQDAELKLSVTDSSVTLTCGKGKYRFQSLRADDFPRVKFPKETVSWKVKESAVAKILADVAGAMGDKDVRYYLNGSLLEIRGQKLQAVSTDGHRLSVSDTEIETPISGEKNQIIPRQAVLLMSRFLEDTDELITMSVTDSSLEVRKGDTVLYTKLIDGRYPDYGRVIPKTRNGYVEIARESLRNAVRRVTLVSDDANKPVRLAFDKDTISITSKNKSDETSEESLDATYDGSPMEIGFNGTYLLDALDTLDDEMVSLALTDPQSPATVTGKGRKMPFFLVMPMRM
jgi:DNA polymerase-3 subunit beta